ncbi:hypothetical protein [Glaciimonas immobilis]|uniref:Uncharacterized protein n=1 Tax=Glaciimonas immobilis TaxID=728004 RepID=A0A840RVM1_9BURK|nr:hypothetical protein [Glaciimonas immobilis]KAF3998299.1 hypothetical protein HAV38_08820 [Glaciimonas immobilis]MBB5201915.1 hypothetical protein [Glaciimonas immobilis]
MSLYKRSTNPVVATERFLPVFIVVALIITVAASLVLLQDIGVMSRQTDRLEAKSGQLATLQSKVDSHRRAIKLAGTSVINTSTESAITVLKRIEAAMSDDISLLRIETDLGRGRMQLHVNAKSSDALFSLVDRLKSQFGNEVFLQRHAQNEVIKDGWILDASLVLGWK